MQLNFLALRSALVAIRNGWSAFWSAESKDAAKFQARLDQIRQQDREALLSEIERIVEEHVTHRLGSAESTTPASPVPSGEEGQ